MKNPITVSDPVFQYKFVIVEKSGSQTWEGGFNRLADLYLLHQQQNQSEGYFEEAKVSLANHVWEKYSVNFSIYYPLKTNEVMKINGEGKQLGRWNQDGPQTMHQACEEVVWLTGMKVKPWEWKVVFDQNVCPKYICYKYSFRNEEEDHTVWEREPSRYVDI